LCKKIIDFGISSSAGPDRLRWFTNAQKTLNAKKMGSFFAPLEAQLLKLMVKERIETKEFEVVDQMIDMLLEVLFVNHSVIKAWMSIIYY
jgi:hypothetical protein